MNASPGAHERPWYRQFWPWFLILIPLLGMAMASITAVYALRHADIVVKDQAIPLDKTSWQRPGGVQ